MTLTPQQLFFDLGKLKVLGMLGEMAPARDLVQTALKTAIPFDDINPGARGPDRDTTQWMHELLLWGMTVEDFATPSQGMDDQGYPEARKTTHALAGSILLLAAIGEVYKPRGRVANDKTPPLPVLPAGQRPFNQQWTDPQPIEPMAFAERLSGCLGDLLPQYKKPAVMDAYFSILSLALKGIAPSDQGFHPVMAGVVRNLERHTYSWDARALGTADKHLAQTIKAIFSKPTRNWTGHEAWTQARFLSNPAHARFPKTTDLFQTLNGETILRRQLDKALPVAKNSVARKVRL